MNRQGIPIPPRPAAGTSPRPALKAPRLDAPPTGFCDVSAVTQDSEARVRRLRGKVRIECPEMLLEADEIDYSQTGEDDEYAEARGNVHYKNFETNEEIWASKVEYYVNREKGKFYDPKGTTEARVEARPGLLTTSQPFYFEGQWAERTGARYILHEGMITNCKMPRPWWTLRGPTFDIIPNERAIAHNAMFRIKKIPLFFTPYFYKSLEKLPRRSGFLTPNVGHSSRLGWMFALGYYWAINRSYDLSYRIQEFTARGQAHHVDLRAKPRQGTDIDLIFYGVADRGQLQNNGDRTKQGGFSISSNIRSELGHGFQARGQINYLSSLVFRQAFTESFQEAVGAEVHSEGFITKQWS